MKNVVVKGINKALLKNLDKDHIEIFVKVIKVFLVQVKKKKVNGKVIVRIENTIFLLLENFWIFTVVLNVNNKIILVLQNLVDINSFSKIAIEQDSYKH